MKNFIRNNALKILSVVSLIWAVTAFFLPATVHLYPSENDEEILRVTSSCFDMWKDNAETLFFNSDYFHSLNAVTKCIAILKAITSVFAAIALIVSVIAAFLGRWYLAAMILTVLGCPYLFVMYFYGIIFSPVWPVFLLGLIVIITTLIFLQRAWKKRKKSL